MRLSPPPGVRFLAVLLLAAPPAVAYRGEGARALARGLAYLQARGDRGVLGEAAAAALPGLDPRARFQAARQQLEAALAAAASGRERTEATGYLVEALEGLGSAAHRLGDAPAEIEALRVARGLAPARPGLALALARALEAGGDLAGAGHALAGLLVEPGLLPATRAEALRERARIAELAAEAGEPEQLEEAVKAWTELANSFEGPSRTTALARLAPLLARLNRAEEALEAFARLAEARELTREEAREYLLARGSAKARRQGGLSLAAADRHFEVQIEEPGHEAAAEALRELFEAARAELGEQLGAFPDGKLLVRIIPAARFRTQVAAGIEAVQRASGVVLKLDLTATLARYRPIVFHEYAHFLVRRRTGGRLPPRWFNEGLAMHCEGGPLPLPWYQRVSRARKQGARLDAAALAAFGDGAPGTLPLAYAEAALLVEHLVAKQGEAVLGRILDGMAAGEDLDAALDRAAGTTTAALLLSWRAAWPEQLRRRLALARAKKEAGDQDRAPWADEAGGPAGADSP